MIPSVTKNDQSIGGLTDSLQTKKRTNTDKKAQEVYRRVCYGKVYGEDYFLENYNWLVSNLTELKKKSPLLNELEGKDWKKLSQNESEMLKNALVATVKKYNQKFPYQTIAFGLKGPDGKREVPGKYGTMKMLHQVLCKERLNSKADYMTFRDRWVDWMDKGVDFLSSSDDGLARIDSFLITSEDKKIAQEFDYNQFLSAEASFFLEDS